MVAELRAPGRTFEVYILKCFANLMSFGFLIIYSSSRIEYQYSVVEVSDQHRGMLQVQNLVRKNPQSMQAEP